MAALSAHTAAAPASGEARIIAGRQAPPGMWPLMWMTPDQEDERLRARPPRFDEIILPHLDAAYDLARWLTRSDDHAQDVVQTACVRALRFFAGFEGRNARAWLLSIVRHAAFDWLRQHRSADAESPFDEELHTAASGGAPADPEALLLARADAASLRAGLEALPPVLREALVLRELEGLSYKEIAVVASIPIGTVMSRLARARRHLQEFLAARGVARRSR